MKKIILFVFLIYSISSFAQMQIQDTVEYKGSNWYNMCTRLGISNLDFSNNTIFIPIYFFKDLESVEAGFQNAIGQTQMVVTYVGKYPQCTYVEQELKEYLASYFNVPIEKIITIAFCE